MLLLLFLISLTIAIRSLTHILIKCCRSQAAFRIPLPGYLSKNSNSLQACFCISAVKRYLSSFTTLCLHIVCLILYSIFISFSDYSLLFYINFNFFYLFFLYFIIFRFFYSRLSSPILSRKLFISSRVIFSSNP